VSSIWLVPLGVGVAGVLALAAAARWLAGEVDALERSVRPVPSRRQVRSGR
jgi:hypothetical protein